MRGRELGVGERDRAGREHDREQPLHLLAPAAAPRDPDEISGERRVHVRILDGAERLQIVVVAVAGQDVVVGDAHVVELDLGVLDLRHERRARRMDPHPRCVRRDPHDPQAVLAGGIRADARHHEQRRRNVRARRPLLAPGQLAARERGLDRARVGPTFLGRAQGRDAGECRHERPQRLRIAAREREAESIGGRAADQRAIDRRFECRRRSGIEESSQQGVHDSTVRQLPPVRISPRLVGAYQKLKPCRGARELANERLSARR